MYCPQEQKMTVVIISCYRVMVPGGQGHELVTPGQCRLSSKSLNHHLNFLCGLKIYAKKCNINHFYNFILISIVHKFAGLWLGNNLSAFWFCRCPVTFHPDFLKHKVWQASRKQRLPELFFCLVTKVFNASWSSQHLCVVNHRKNISWFSDNTISSISSEKIPGN